MFGLMFAAILAAGTPEPDVHADDLKSFEARYGPWQQVQAAYELAVNHREWLDERAWDNQANPHWNDIYDQAKASEWAWWCLYRAMKPPEHDPNEYGDCYSEEPLWNAANLRRQIGPDAYYYGLMPIPGHIGP